MIEKVYWCSVCSNWPRRWGATPPKRKTYRLTSDFDFRTALRVPIFRPLLQLESIWEKRKTPKSRQFERFVVF